MATDINGVDMTWRIVVLVAISFVIGVWLGGQVALVGSKDFCALHMANEMSELAFDLQMVAKNEYAKGNLEQARVRMLSVLRMREEIDSLEKYSASVADLLLDFALRTLGAPGGADLLKSAGSSNILEYYGCAVYFLSNKHEERSVIFAQISERNEKITEKQCREKGKAFFLGELQEWRKKRTPSAPGEAGAKSGGESPPGGKG